MAEHITTLLSFARHLRGWDETVVDEDGKKKTIHHDGVYETAKKEAQEKLAKKTKEIKEFLRTKDIAKEPKAERSPQQLLKEYAELEKQIKNIRAKIGQVLMPADRDGLVVKERELILKLRKKRVAVLDSGAKLETLESEKDIAESQLEKAESAVKQADRMLIESEERDKQHSDWKKAIEDGGPLSQLKSQADARLNERTAVVPVGEKPPLIQKAKSRVESDIPEVLRTRARERGVEVDENLTGDIAQLKALKTAQTEHRAAIGGIPGLVGQRWSVFEQAEAELKDLVLQSATRYEQAMTLLKIVVDSKELTEDQTNRIADVAVNGGETNALTEEKKRDDARAEVTQAKADVKTKETEVELAIVQALVKDTDADPEDDDVVTQKRSELGDAKSALAEAQAALTTAEEKFEPPMRDDLDDWEAAIPDHIWANLVAFDNAVGLLTAIKDSSPNSLAAGMESAEQSLVKLLVVEDENARVDDALETDLSFLEGQHEHLRNAHHQRKLGAVRGDA